VAGAFVPTESYNQIGPFQVLPTNSEETLLVLLAGLRWDW
jgi:hypothetical protein